MFRKDENAKRFDQKYDFENLKDFLLCLFITIIKGLEQKLQLWEP
jgi:hypothetical protein